jgi:hypothetical protein
MTDQEVREILEKVITGEADTTEFMKIFTPNIKGETYNGKFIKKANKEI